MRELQIATQARLERAGLQGRALVAVSSAFVDHHGSVRPDHQAFGAVPPVDLADRRVQGRQIGRAGNGQVILPLVVGLGEQEYLAAFCERRIGPYWFCRNKVKMALVQIFRRVKKPEISLRHFMHSVRLPKLQAQLGPERAAWPTQTAPCGCGA